MHHGIWIAAAVVSILSLGLIGSAILWLSRRQNTGFLLLAIAMQLPMALLVFYGLRLPLDNWLWETLGTGSELHHFLRNLFAPVLEETAKLWPLLLVSFRRRINGNNAVFTGLALGLGFGVSEVWLIAELLSGKPFIASLHWYQLNGYIGERFLVCVHHGAMTATALWWWHRRGSLGWGILAAMGLHLLGNAPLYLAARNLGGLGRNTWGIINSLWVPGFFFGMIALLSYYIFGHVNLRELLFGRARCPDCGTEYLRSMWALNLVTYRFERCPNCRRWHLTKRLSQKTSPD